MEKEITKDVMMIIESYIERVENIEIILSDILWKMFIHGFILGAVFGAIVMWAIQSS